MTTVIRLADARLSASTMMSCSMIHWLIGAVWLCSTKASLPRTDSRNRTMISPLAKSYSFAGAGSIPMQSATSAASSGKARPPNNIIFFWLGAVMPLTWYCSPSRPYNQRQNH